ncbi:fasciclin domain-containing protein [Altererythrobacter sediminis]|uniref:Fasciclin domain-containing protein n=2 Tax=Allopontixanthobacter sediminis TaxID=1689985 RepID=A0A845B3Z9_9SPHN|nr:fasciclin domain-containing protein [Allopontixanthobacter sediminis]
MPSKFQRLAVPLTAFAIMGSGCTTMDSGMDSGMQSASASSEQTVMVGGAEMFPTRNIIENAVNSADHTTLVAAVKAAGLVETLSGPGPFTVFAPTNAAFAKLPAGTVDTLLKPENKAALSGVLTYHVVPGRVTARDLMRMIDAGGGMAQLKTVNGGTLTARLSGGNVVLVDAKGGTATVTQADVMQSNGVIHVTNAVSLPG